MPDRIEPHHLETDRTANGTRGELKRRFGTSKFDPTWVIG